jgi:putative ABC transport system ATP-binding protein
MIEVRGLTKSVTTAEGGLAILKGLDLEIKAGESVAIVGASGSGKSTLLGLLAGLDDATSGQILIDGVNLTLMSEEQRAGLRARLVGFVFQNFQLLPTLTALENVMLPLELMPRDVQTRQALRQCAEQFLAQVGLSHRQHHYPRQLSGGEQQRVAIARAFSAQPKILFADEPTGNLDKKNAQRIADVLFELNARHHTTLVLVTHDMRLAERCQRILWMDEGQLFDSDPVPH